MFALDFPFPDVLRIWDMAFSEMDAVPCLEPTNIFKQWLDPVIHIGILDFLVQFACAMLLCIRDEIINGDFDDNMLILQSYPMDVTTVCNQVARMRSPSKLPIVEDAPVKSRYKWNFFGRKSKSSLTDIDLDRRPKNIESDSRSSIGKMEEERIKLSKMDISGDDDIISLN